MDQQVDAVRLLHRAGKSDAARAGKNSGFSYGRSVGAVEAVVAMCSIPMTLVEGGSGNVSFILKVRTRKAPASARCNCFLLNTHYSILNVTTAAPKPH